MTSNNTSSSPNNIVTHNGIFHADEAFACAVLTTIWPDATVLRTRDRTILESAAVNPKFITVDVGGKYDANELVFDHHFKDGPARENGVPLSGFGLIWRHFGTAFLNTALFETDEILEEIHEAVDAGFVSRIDAGDTGAVESTAHLKGNPELELQDYGVSWLISSLNPVPLIEDDITDEERDHLFTNAISVARGVLQRVVYRACSRIMAREMVKEAIDGQLCVLDQFAPWQDAIFEADPDGEVLYVLFPATGGDWRIQCVPPTPGSFDKRKALPEKWAGLRDEEFQKETGVEDAIFCHPGRFIAGAQSKEGALKLADLAVANTSNGT